MRLLRGVNTEFERLTVNISPRNDSYSIKNLEIDEIASGVFILNLRD